MCAVCIDVGADVCYRINKDIQAQTRSTEGRLSQYKRHFLFSFCIKSYLFKPSLTKKNKAVERTLYLFYGCVGSSFAMRTFGQHFPFVEK